MGYWFFQEFNIKHQICKLGLGQGLPWRDRIVTSYFQGIPMEVQTIEL
jgi:hypothetical protein